MKKLFVKSLSLGLAMITMITLLIASMIPVSAVFYPQTVEDSLGNQLKGYLTVHYTPATDSMAATFQDVTGSAYLYTGDTIPTTHTVYLIAAAGVKYTNESGTYYLHHYKEIEDLEPNYTYGKYAPTISFDQTKTPESFHHYSKLSFESEMGGNDYINGLKLNFYKHRSYILTNN